jgi:hypothetical protein
VITWRRPVGGSAVTSTDAVTDESAADQRRYPAAARRAVARRHTLVHRRFPIFR